MFQISILDAYLVIAQFQIERNITVLRVHCNSGINKNQRKNVGAIKNILLSFD